MYVNETKDWVTYSGSDLRVVSEDGAIRSPSSETEEPITAAVVLLISQTEADILA